MSRDTEPAIATATRLEPILICYDGSAGFQAQPRGELAGSTWEGIVDVGLTGLKKIVYGSLSQQLLEHAGRPVLIVPPPR